MAGPITIRVLADTASASRNVSALGDRMKSAGKLAAGALAGGLAAGTAAVVALGVASVKSLNRIQQINAQTSQAIRSTGGAAGVSAQHIENLTGRLENMTATEAESTQQGANLLLTFTNIRNGVGKANKIFDQATSVLVDMARAMGTDPSAAAIQLGKALNDPVKGITALTRVGVSFTGEQQTLIGSLVKSGKTMQAQKIILGELNKEFGGSGKAFAATTAGKITLVGHAFGTLGESIFSLVLPPLADLATNAAKTFNALAVSPKVIALSKVIGGALANAYAVAADRVGQLAAAFEAGGIDGAVQKLDDLTGAGGRLLPALNFLETAAKNIGLILVQSVLPAVQDGAQLLPSFTQPLQLAGSALQFMADHADLTKTALEGLVLYLGLSKGAVILQSLAVKAGVGPLAAYASAADRTAARTKLLGTALRGAAGIGGMLAIVDSSKQTDRSLGTLEAAAGGALTGFALGGPIGAAIGAGAGALLGLSQNTDDAAQAAHDAIQPTTDYAGSLDKITGAATAATRAQIIQTAASNGTLDKAKALGISARDLSRATLGNVDAMRRVQQALHAAREDFTVTLKDPQDPGEQVVRTVQSLKELQQLLRNGPRTLKLSDVVSPNVTGVQKFIGSQRTQIKEQGKLNAEIARTGQNLGKLKGVISKPLFVRLQSQGLPATAKGLAGLINQHRQLDKAKTIRLLVDASKTTASVKQVQGLINKLRETDDVKPTLRNYSRGLQTDLTAATATAHRGGQSVSKAMTDQVNNARGNLAQFSGSIVSGTNRAKGLAASGGRGVGNALKQGVLAGFAGTQSLLAAQASAAVAAGIAAAKSRAKIHSPSREMFYVGDMMSRGLVEGVKSGWPATQAAAKTLADIVRAEVVQGSAGVGKAIETVTKRVTKAYDEQAKAIQKTLKDRQHDLAADLKATEKSLHARLKGKALDEAIHRAEKANRAELQAAQKAAREATKKNRQAQAAELAGLKGQYTALRANARLQDQNAAQLKSAVSRYKQLVSAARSYAASVKASIVGTGNVTAFLGEDGTTTSSAITTGLQNALVKAQRFANLIQKLTKAGLNKTSLRQLLDQGVDGGLATAEALAAGGASAIQQTNQLTNQLNQIGKNLGDSTAATFYKAGIRAAEGVVEGLKAKQAALDKAAQRLGQQLADAVKKALGIHSPSRVMAGIADNTVEGLTRQLKANEVHVRRAGASLAAATVTGYTSAPAMDARTAYASVRSSAASSGGRTITLQLTAQEQTDMQRGRAVVREVDAVTLIGKRRRRG